GGTRDSTGLTRLGAREYEPATGRFISDDIVTDASDPAQINGYSYAGNAPTNASDANGLRTCNGAEDCANDPCRGNPACHQGRVPAPPMKCSWWDTCGPTHGNGPPPPKKHGPGIDVPDPGVRPRPSGPVTLPG